MKVNRRDLIKAGVTVLGTGALAGVAGGQEESADFDRYCAFKGPTDARDLLEPEGCAYVYLDEGDGSVYISRQEEDGWTQFAGGGAPEPALTWDATDLDNGTDNGVVHENTANTAYDNVSLIRKGDATAAPLYASNLVAWYPLQEASGASTAHDFSGNGYDGTINGATPAGGANLCGTNSYFFDGNDDWIDLGRDFDFTNGLTVCAWVRAPNGADGFRSIIDPYDGSRDAFRFYKQKSAFGNDIKFETASGAQSTDGGTDVTDGIWRHYAGVYNPDTDDLFLYENGSSVSSDTDANALADDNPSNYAIGRRQDGTFYWSGDLADIRIYEVALSASQIQEIYDVFSAESSHEFVYKGPSPSSSPTALFTSVTIPSGASATLEFLEDTNTDGTAENTDSVAMSDGVTDYTASGLAGTGDLALRVTLENTDLTVASTVEVPVEVSG